MAVAVWCIIEKTNTLPESGRIEHFLWKLMFLNIYGKTKTMSTLSGGVDVKTLRKYVRLIIDAISILEPAVIVFNNRFKLEKGNDCLLSVDGTDFQIEELGNKFYSHKFLGSALRYEVAICILTGDILWIHGPFEPGLYPDISIFRNALKHHLSQNERVEADDGYVGDSPEHVKCPKSFTLLEETKFIQTRVRSRQE